LITAVGLSFVFRNVGLKWNGSTPKQWPSVISTGGFTIGGLLVRWSLIVTALLLFVLTFIVQRTRQGKAMRATQDRLMGVNLGRTISFPFALGGAGAGAAAVLSVQTLGTIRSDHCFQVRQRIMEKV
jgi:branched-chain amino acid transport system permease protein